MSIEEPEQPASKPAPLLQTLGDPAAGVCVDGVCAVPEPDAATTNTTSTRGAST